MSYTAKLTSGLIFLVVAENHLLAQIEDRFVLLRSGTILEGQLEKKGSESKINLAGGDYFVLKNEQIEKTFRSRRDIFRYKTAVTPLNIHSQNDLIHWLCKNKSFQIARDHLSSLRNNPGDLKISDLDRLIVTIRQKESQDSGKNASSANFISGDERSSLKVAKHLALGCAISGCHRDSKKTGFLLKDIGDLSHRSITLQTTLDLIKEIGTKSFLNRVSQKHGPLKRGIYPTATREYLEIATWVNRSSLSGIPSGQRPGNHQPKIEASNLRPVGKVASIPSFRSPPSISIQPSDDEIKTGKPKTDNFVPVDEFDPEIFNRRYGNNSPHLAGELLNSEAAKEAMQKTSSTIGIQTQSNLPVPNKLNATNTKWPQRLISPHRNFSKK